VRDEDVGRLEVTVDDASMHRAVLVSVNEVVRVLDAFENLLEEVESAFNRQSPMLARDELRERAALDVLHDNEVSLLRDDVVVDFDDAGMVELRLYEGFALEAVAHPTQVVRPARANGLERHHALQRHVPPTINDAHPTAPDGLFDHVVADFLTGIHPIPARCGDK
jgi:hypothetical protein